MADLVANYIYEGLRVNHVFMVTGAGIMHLTDAVACHKKLKAICPHHEQTSSMALEAYSRATENFGVGCFTTGPGSTNAITGLTGAMATMGYSLPAAIVVSIDSSFTN